MLCEIKDCNTKLVIDTGLVNTTEDAVWWFGARGIDFSEIQTRYNESQTILFTEAT